MEGGGCVLSGIEGVQCSEGSRGFNIVRDRGSSMFWGFKEV